MKRRRDSTAGFGERIRSTKQFPETVRPIHHLVNRWMRDARK